MYDANVYKPKWLVYVKSLIDKCGFSFLWDFPNTCNLKWLKASLHQKIDDIAIQEWQSEVFSNSLCKSYRIFKSEYGYCKYLNVLDTKRRISLCKFRCANHKLPVVTGRYDGIDRNVRFCTLCDNSNIGDEYHYLYECPTLCEKRRNYLKKYYRTRPNTIKTNELFINGNKKILNDLAAFAEIIMKCFN